MCVTCGCGQPGKARVEGEPVHDHPQGDHQHHSGHAHSHSHSHEHGHEHEHEHEHVLPDGTRVRHRHAPHPLGPLVPAAAPAALDWGSLRRQPPAELVSLETSLLEKNQRIADHNRSWLTERGVMSVNLMSSPGAGKTTLLVRTLTDLGQELPVSVVEGDQETSADAERIRAAGAAAVQVNTGAGCHLEADMLQRALHTLAPVPGGVLFIENVGNLVCPALFDLGEHARVVILSVTEGDDKPLKYPHMFKAAQLLILTKLDLLPYVDFDPDRAEANARTVNPQISTLRLSASSGAGLKQWYDQLRSWRSGFVHGIKS